MNGEFDELAERVRGHDSSALAEFMQLRHSALFAYIDRRLGAELRGKVQADDVLQELAVKALRELGGTDLSGRDPFGWLCQLAEQCIIDDHRRFSAGKRASTREVSGNVRIGDSSQDLIALLAASLTSPTQAVVRNERQARLDSALVSFPAEHRELLRLRYVEGLATKDVAARVGKSEVATRVLLSRLIHRLQELLGAAETG